MSDCTDHQVRLPELTMSYAEAGEGSNTILFVHSYGSSRLSWREVMEDLPADFRSVAVDLRGCGDSDKPETGHTVKQMSEDVYQFARSQQLKDFTMVGHSIGGAITIDFAAEHPELLKSIIMVNPAPADGVDLPPEDKEQMMAVLKSRDPEGVGQILRMMALAPDAQVEQEVIDIMVSDSLKASDGFLEQAMADLEGLDLGSKLSRIDLPALMIHGDRDAAVPMADSIKTFERISGCSLHVFYGCGHSPQVECGEDFLNLLISFSRNPRKREDIAGQA